MSKYNLGFRCVIQEIENFDIGTIIECENGNKYELRLAENGQRKFSRKDGTKLRFMTYDNIDKMFRILEEDETIDIDNIEEIKDSIIFRVDDFKGEINKSYLCDLLTRQNTYINKILQWAKQIDKEIKSIKEK